MQIPTDATPVMASASWSARSSGYLGARKGGLQWRRASLQRTVAVTQYTQEAWICEWLGVTPAWPDTVKDNYPRRSHSADHRGVGGQSGWLRESTPFSALLVSLWCSVILPPTVSLLSHGPASSDAEQTIVEDAGYAIVRYSCLALVALAGIWVVGVNITNRRVLRASALLPVVICGGMIVVESMLNGGTLHFSMILVMALAVVCVFVEPRTVNLNCIGTLTIVLAALSLVLGMEGSGLMKWWSWGQEKALIFGAALAGPFTTANVLGRALVLGLPFVLAIPRRSIKRIGIFMVVLALLWTASRTSLIAAAAVSAGFFLLRARWMQRMKWRLAAGCGPLILSALVPYLGWPDNAFTARGFIWRLSKSLISRHPETGIGAEGLLPGGALAQAVGAVVYSAHNTALNLILQYGYPLGVLVFASVVVPLGFAISKLKGPLLPCYGIALGVLSCTESIRLEPVGSSVCTVVPFVFLLAHFVGGRHTLRELAGSRQCLRSERDRRHLSSGHVR
jgi:hypothetical protein